MNRLFCKQRLQTTFAKFRASGNGNWRFLHVSVPEIPLKTVFRTSLGVKFHENALRSAISAQNAVLDAPKTLYKAQGATLTARGHEGLPSEPKIALAGPYGVFREFREFRVAAAVMPDAGNRACVHPQRPFPERKRASIPEFPSFPAGDPPKPVPSCRDGQQRGGKYRIKAPYKHP